MTHIRPRRSVLYMPGSNARALEKAKSLPADALILDLEDAVAPEAKDTARAQVCAAVKAGGLRPAPRWSSASNALDTAWGARRTWRRMTTSRGPPGARLPPPRTPERALYPWLRRAAASSRSRISASAGSDLAFSSARAFKSCRHVRARCGAGGCASSRDPSTWVSPGYAIVMLVASRGAGAPPSLSRAVGFRPQRAGGGGSLGI